MRYFSNKIGDLVISVMSDDLDFIITLIILKKI